MAMIDIRLKNSTGPLLVSEDVLWSDLARPTLSSDVPGMQTNVPAFSELTLLLSGPVKHLIPRLEVWTIMLSGAAFPHR